MMDYTWLIPLFPLLGFLICGLGRNVLRKSGGWIASFMILLSFLGSLSLYFSFEGKDAMILPLYDFIHIQSLSIPFSLRIDNLTILFLLIITGIGFLIHLYSIAYMREDKGVSKYFAYLNLFVFFMLLLVMGSNYIIMFIGWEGVGLCSYLLIGFWYEKQAFASAAKKAFVMNRIGDLGFLIALFLIFAKVGTFEFDALEKISFSGQLGDVTYLTAIALCLFIGATGKSAQIPLFTWLPDAMAGPTPVSALIHAATMVTAGIYMVTRSHFIFSLSPAAQQVILLIGLVTALVAATIATRQNDIKKVLAYSTVSQLGFMFMALGVGAYVSAVFHVMTHAFFKALLFLGSGSVIHALHHEQDIRKMGGLKDKLPITYWTFFIGCLAIAGIPIFSGFFSKDEIMMHVFVHPTFGKIFWALGMLAALMTAYYMFRLLFVTFYGRYRGDAHTAAHIHESPSLMTIPLIILAVLSTIGGFVGLPEMMGTHRLKKFLEPVIEKTLALKAEVHGLSHSMEYVLMGIAVLIALIGIVLAWVEFKRYDASETYTGLAKIAEDKWYFDEAYEKVIEKPLMQGSSLAENYIEKKTIDGTVNGIGTLVKGLGSKVRLLQNGMVGFYLFLMVLGVIILFIIQLLFLK